jgi:hypothetical protein
VVADNVQFIGPREGGGAPRETGAAFAAAPDVAEGDFGDEDIPF